MLAGATDEERLTKARTALRMIERASQLQDERQVVVEIEQLIRYFLRTEPFKQVATAEERIAAQYILARAALYRVAYEHGED